MFVEENLSSHRSRVNLKVSEEQDLSGAKRPWLSLWESWQREALTERVFARETAAFGWFVRRGRRKLGARRKLEALSVSFADSSPRGRAKGVRVGDVLNRGLRGSLTQTHRTARRSRAVLICFIL